jgi:hypothetical protein
MMTMMIIIIIIIMIIAWMYRVPLHELIIERRNIPLDTNSIWHLQDNKLHVSADT